MFFVWGISPEDVVRKMAKMVNAVEVVVWGDEIIVFRTVVFTKLISVAGETVKGGMG